MLDESQRKELLGVARRTLEVYLSTGRRPVVETSGDALLEPCGAFVTLRRADDGRLRGCIGTFESRDPLVDTVQRMAVSAATEDPRFAAVGADEVPELHLEISVLSPLRPGSAEEVEVGTHGIFVTRGWHRGVLLPQVATDHGWDRETFLRHTCIKAGLDPEAWRDPDTRIQLFTAEVFEE